MPILSTNRGHIGSSHTSLHLSYVDCDPVKTRKESGRSSFASSVRWSGCCIAHDADGPPESVGNNEKSIWEHYNEMREIEWRDLADTILVFVCLSTLYDALLLIWLQDGLFAAFLSAFLVFTIPQLQANSTDITMDVLIHISQQLSNSTIPAYTPTEFTVSPSIATVNVLFFLSLALVLIDAFLAMLVKSWLQEFDHGWRKYTVANLRAREREQRLQGLERWKLAELVALLPILIQVSLLFFCAGLLVLLFPIHLISAIFSSLALLAGLTFYAFTTYVSIFDSYAPFSSPVSRGLVIIINALQTTWMTFARNVHDITSTLLSHISRPLSHRDHEQNVNTSPQPLPVNSSVARLPSPHNKGTKAGEAVTRSHSQIDHQTYVCILERLVTTTAEVVENIPVFLELLDQPVKDLTLRPSNVEDLKHLLYMILGLLGDSSTLSDPAARTIARTMVFCYDDSRYGDQQLSQRLKYHFGHPLLDQTDKKKPLNSLFASYLYYYCDSWPARLQAVNSTIASLEPSNAADVELLWMVNTIHKNLQWKYHQSGVYGPLLDFFAAVLTYVSSTEQSRRSQVPLTAAIIYAMHTIRSALDTSNISSIDGHYVIPRTVYNTFESMFVTFHQVDGLDLWSDDCVELASGLLQPDTHWLRPHSHLSRPSAHGVSKFQLALIAALYIDSTKRAGHATTAFKHLLKLINIATITEKTWGWTVVYDQTKLASYWHMALFQQPLYQYNSPVQDIGYVVIKTIERCSETKLSVLHLFDICAKHLCAMASSSSNLFPRDRGNGHFKWTTPSGHITHVVRPRFDDWVLLHLDTLFSPDSIIKNYELMRLQWADTTEQVHIAKARLALYDSSQGEGAKQLKQLKRLKPDPHLLKMFLWSKDYDVCTGAFKWCLHLATISHPSTPGDVGIAGVFIPGAMGHQWVEHLMRVLCGVFEHEMVSSWEFLDKHLAPIWAVLPPSWCCDFALVFLFSDVCLRDQKNQSAYKCFTTALTDQASKDRNTHAYQGFLHFLETVLELVKHRLNWDQLTSLETWLAWLSDLLQTREVHLKLETILATRKQHILDETLGYFAELPMIYPDWMSDLQ